jgi:hypothetical protein
MHKKLLSILFLISLIIPISSKAIFDEIFECESPTGQKLICCADTHLSCDDPKKAMEQQNALIAQAQQLMAIGKTVHVVAEDMSDYHGDKKKLKENLLRGAKNPMSPLQGLIAKCRSAGVNCTNIEFRYVNAAIGETIGLFKTKNISQTLHDVLKFQDIQLEEHSSETTKMKDEIRAYNDASPILQEKYNRILFEANKLLFEANVIRKELQKEDPDYASQFKKYAGRISLLADKILLADCQLLDARILHELFLNKDKDYIILCAGGEHIDNIKSTLFSIGYKINSREKARVEVDQQNNTLILKAESAANIHSFFESSKQRQNADKKEACEKTMQEQNDKVHPKRIKITYSFLKGMFTGVVITTAAFGLYKWLKG